MIPNRFRCPITLGIVAGFLVSGMGCGGDTTPMSRKIGGEAKTSTGGGSSSSAQAGGAAAANHGGNATTATSGGLASGGTRATGGSPPILQDDWTAAVTLAPSTTYQTLEGFGAAIAWYQGTLTSHRKKAEIYQVLFGELGLDILRFRNTFGRSEFGSATAEKDILDAATSSLGRRPRVLMTSWSPPAALKANSSERCSGEATCTLKQVNGVYPYDGFADYWRDAVAAYRNAGVAPDWVSIQNEPDFVPSGWEGCRFAPRESSEFPGYAEALAAVSSKLGVLMDAPKLIGPETLGVHWKKMENYMPALDKGLLLAAAHHLYEMGNDGVWDWRDPGPDSYVTAMKGGKAAVGSLPVFQTEFQTDDDKNIEGGFETAWLIHNSLVEEGVSAWLYWDLVWGAGRGMVSLPDTTNYSIRDQYYSVRHYSLYTDPGYVRVGATASNPDVRVSAYRSPDQKRITVVVLNVGSSEQRIGLDLGGFAATSSEVYRTTYVPGISDRWATQPSIAEGGKVILPGRSVATIVLGG